MSWISGRQIGEMWRVEGRGVLVHVHFSLAHTSGRGIDEAWMVIDDESQNSNVSHSLDELSSLLIAHCSLLLRCLRTHAENFYVQLI